MKRKTAKLAWAFLGAGALLLALDVFVLEHYFFQVKKFKIGKQKSKSSPLRLLHLTDLHFGHSLYPHHFKLIRRIRKLKPHVLLISGDSVDQNGDLRPFEKFLRLLPHDLPKIAIPGNHDYVAHINLSHMREILENCNGQLLISETCELKVRNRRLHITGFDDIIQGEPNLDQAFRNAHGHRNHIGLIHSPLHFETISEEMEKLNENRPKDQQINMSYFLAGHNHGGQVSLGHYAPVLPPKSGDFVEGWYSEQDAPYLYLSRGFGTSRFPVRFMAPAEVSLFHYYT